MIPHSWLSKCMMMFGIAENIQMLLVNSMEKQKAKLTPVGQKLGTVNMRRAKSQEDSLPPLLLVLAIIPIWLVLKEVKPVYQLGDLREKINHLLFLDDLKLYRQNKRYIDKLLKTVIQQRHQNGIQDK